MLERDGVRGECDGGCGGDTGRWTECRLCV